MATYSRAVGAVASALLVFSTGAAVSSAQAPQSGPTTFFGVTFLPEIAGAARISVRDYEQTNPGLGYSVGYRRAQMVATVYIYDMGQRTIPDDPQAAVIKAQFERAKADIVNAQRQGLWSQVELKESFVVKDARGRDRLLCISLAVVPKDGPATKDSVLCVGSVNNKFLKFRLTTNQHAGSQNETRRFLDAWMSLLWPLSERQL